nr:MAG TPA: hypothetical protein [Caudoviricetes sp.]
MFNLICDLIHTLINNIDYNIIKINIGYRVHTLSKRVCVRPHSSIFINTK